jgi:hypothetical protein
MSEKNDVKARAKARNKAEGRLQSLPAGTPNEVVASLKGAEATFWLLGKADDGAAWIYSKDKGVTASVSVPAGVQGDSIVQWLWDVLSEGRDNDFVTYVATTTDNDLHVIVMSRRHLHNCFCPIKDEKLGEWDIQSQESWR